MKKFLWHNTFSNDGKLFDDSHLIITCMLAFTIPLSTPGNGLAVILSAVFVIFSLIHGKITLIRAVHPLFYTMIFFYFMHVIGFLYTENIQNGQSILVKRISLIILPLFFCYRNKNFESVKAKATYSFIFALIMVGIILISNAIRRSVKYKSFISPNSYTLNDENHFFYHSYSDLLGHAIYYGAFYAIGISLLFYLIKAKKIKKNLGILIGLFFALNLFFLSPRIVIVFLAVIGLPLLILYLKESHLTKKEVLLIVSVYLLVGYVSYQVESVKKRIDDVLYSNFSLGQIDYDPNKYMDGVEFRLAKWQYTIEAIKRGNLLIGVGVGDGQDKLEDIYRENDFLIGYIDHYNPHNQYLSTFLELGFLGLMMYLSIFFISFKFSIQERNIMLAYLLVLIILFSITESILTRQRGVLMISFFLPFLYTFFAEKKKGN